MIDIVVMRRDWLCGELAVLVGSCESLDELGCLCRAMDGLVSKKYEQLLVHVGNGDAQVGLRG